jgi:hypothetical protein
MVDEPSKIIGFSWLMPVSSNRQNGDTYEKDTIIILIEKLTIWSMIFFWAPRPFRFKFTFFDFCI